MLNEIDENNVMIHDKKDSDGRLTDSNAEEDREQINKWKKKDEEMDGAIDDIIVGVRGLKGKVQRMNEAQDVINEKTKKGVEKADKLANRIQGDNEKLKKIIEDVSFMLVSSNQTDAVYTWLCFCCWWVWWSLLSRSSFDPIILFLDYNH